MTNDEKIELIHELLVNAVCSGLQESDHFVMMEANEREIAGGGVLTVSDIGRIVAKVGDAIIEFVRSERHAD